MKKDDKTVATLVVVVLIACIAIWGNKTYGEELTNANTTPITKEISVVPAPSLVDERVPTSTSSSEAHSDTFGGDPVPMVPPENTGSLIATEAVSEGSAHTGELDIPQEEEELGYVDKLWNYLNSVKEAAKERGITFYKERKFAMEYGPDNATPENIAVLEERQLALRIAEDKRTQALIDLEVREAEREELLQESIMCLALNGFYEARGETADQEVATAAVVLNRLSVGFRGATTVCGVIQTPAQFSWILTHGLATPDITDPVEEGAWQRSLLIAKSMLDPDATFIDPSNGALYYYNPSIVDWKYKKAYDQVAVLGNHRFMTERNKKHPHYINNRDVRINPALLNGLSHDEREALKKEFQLKNKG